VLFALQNPKSKSKISSILLNKTLTKRDVKTVLELTMSGEGFERSEILMRKWADEALSLMKPQQKLRRELQYLVYSLLPETSEHQIS
jgi:geranylgeranyl pyrophosphate synthase